MSKTIGVIGLGSIGKRHAKSLVTMGHKVIGYDPNIVGLTSLYDVDGGKIDLYSYEDILGAADGYVIASPTPTHWEYASNFVGLATHVFVEKPIADRYYEKLYRVDMVGYNLRFHSCVKEAKRWIANEVPVWAYFTCAQKNNKPAYLRDGVILNWSHEIDLALYLLGPAKVVASSTRLSRGSIGDDAEGQDDITDILLLHQNGCRTTIHLDYVTEPQERHFTIQCVGTRLKADLIGNVLAEVPENGPPDIVNYPNTFDDNYIEEMQAFIDRIDGKETIGATGEDGLRALEICLEVRKQAGLP